MANQHFITTQTTDQVSGGVSIILCCASCFLCFFVSELCTLRGTKGKEQLENADKQEKSVSLHVNTSEHNGLNHHTHRQPLEYLHDGLHDSRVSTHAQIVVAAPHRHLPLISQRACEVVGHGELVGQTIHCLKHTVCVVTLLLFYLLLEKAIILEAGHYHNRKTKLA